MGTDTGRADNPDGRIHRALSREKVIGAGEQEALHRRAHCRSQCGGSRVRFHSRMVPQDDAIGQEGQVSVGQGVSE
jgi:hypothetical protein